MAKFAGLVPGGHDAASPKKGWAGTSGKQSSAPDGPYMSSTRTCGRYKNVAACADMLGKLARLSSGAAHTIDWQLNLRGSDYHKTDNKWRRYFQRPAQSFDRISENRRDEEYRRKYEASPTTPMDSDIDRRTGAMPVATRRETPGAFDRCPGCEGAQVGQWRHMLLPSARGTNRDAISTQTTLRDPPLSARKRVPAWALPLGDNRSDVCLVEMLGKKKWVGARSPEPLAHAPPAGDPKLFHLNNLKPVAEPDDEARRIRTTPHPSSRCESRNTDGF